MYACTHTCTKTHTVNNYANGDFLNFISYYDNIPYGILYVYMATIYHMVCGKNKVSST